MKPEDIKRLANSIRKCRTGESYYDKKYKDLSVSDLLLVLEDENYHTEETLVEVLITLNYFDILEACKIITEQDKYDYLPDELEKRRQKLDKKVRS